MKKYTHPLSRFFLFLLMISVFPKVYGIPPPAIVPPLTVLAAGPINGGIGVRVTFNITEASYKPYAIAAPSTFILLRSDRVQMS